MAIGSIDIWCINMNSALAAMMLADAQAVTAEAGQTVTINSVAYAAMVSDATLTQTLDAGGLMDNITTTIKIPATTAALAAAAYMALGKKLTWNGRTYRITGKTTKPGSAWVQLAVVDDDHR
jgi:hypothetical protein